MQIKTDVIYVEAETNFQHWLAESFLLTLASHHDIDIHHYKKTDTPKVRECKFFGETGSVLNFIQALRREDGAKIKLVENPKTNAIWGRSK